MKERWMIKQHFKVGMHDPNRSLLDHFSSISYQNNSLQLTLASDASFLSNNLDPKSCLLAQRTDDPAGI